MNTTAFNLGFKAVASVISAKRTVVDSTSNAVLTTKDVGSSFWAGMRAAASSDPLAHQFVDVKGNAPRTSKPRAKKPSAKK